MGMRKIVALLILLVLFGGLGFPVSVDLKTKFGEKGEITAIKVGATYWLEKSGVQVVNIGEDFSVWLKDLERKFVEEGHYAYSLMVTLSFPTSLVEKRAIKEEKVRFEIFMDVPLKDEEEGLDERLKRRFFKLKDRLKKEAYIGGLVVASTIVKLLRAVGAATDG